mmetsp:Transcript_114461/g.318685  ORF Transcript_114461/g.318685 Transcript_114461/m.318685 type:complete len:278 (+) Transcript_114461:407-1240(+)
MRVKCLHRQNPHLSFSTEMVPDGRPSGKPMKVESLTIRRHRDLANGGGSTFGVRQIMERLHSGLNLFQAGQSSKHMVDGTPQQPSPGLQRHMFQDPAGPLLLLEQLRDEYAAELHDEGAILPAIQDLGLLHLIVSHGRREHGQREALCYCILVGAECLLQRVVQEVAEQFHNVLGEPLDEGARHEWDFHDEPRHVLNELAPHLLVEEDVHGTLYEDLDDDLLRRRVALQAVRERLQVPALPHGLEDDPHHGSNETALVLLVQIRELAAFPADVVGVQ